jgi:hypothetical protein
MEVPNLSTASGGLVLLDAIGAPVVIETGAEVRNRGI